MGNLFSSPKVGRGSTLNLSRNQVIDILKTQMNLTNTTCLIINDKDYIALDREKFKEFAKQDSTDKLKYKSERSDCDDFTRVFLGNTAKNVFKYGSSGNRGLAIGEVQGTIYKDNNPVEHSMVIAIFNRGGQAAVELFEPQNDKFYSLDGRNIYWSVHV